MKRHLLICFLSGLTLFSFSQTVTIRDLETGRPLEAVSLFSEHPKAYAITNAEGQARISAFRGSDHIQIRSMGYTTMSTSFSALEEAGFEIPMEVSSVSLDEVVVSATRWRQVTSNVPSRVISIPAQEVALQKPQTAADLLGISGKVFIQKSQQGGGSPMIRGFAANRLIYTVDGVRMNTAIFRSGNLQNVISLDPFAMENTEVLFGPGSVIYGSDAIGGVMGFQTLTPQLTLTGKPLITGKAVVRYATANREKTGHVDVNVGWKKWAMVTSFSSWDFGHLRQGSHGPEDYIKDHYVQRQNNADVVITQDDPLLQIPSAYSQINLMQKVLYQPTEHLEFQYGFHYSETSPYGRYDRHNRVRNGTARYAEWDYGPQKWMMNHLSVSHTRENSLYDQLMFRLAWQSFEESRIDRALNDP
jgi:hemoglobin/transferrin/lactoferrin receptor protein